LRHDGNQRPQRHRATGARRTDQGRRAGVFPELTATDFDGVKPWFGYRPVSPDGLPYIGRLGRYANLATASGHAMLGLTMAPISGLLITEVLSGRKPSVDLSLLNPNRLRLILCRPVLVAGPISHLSYNPVRRLAATYTQTPMNWKGVLPAVTTNLKADLSVDHEAFAAHCRWMIDTAARHRLLRLAWRGADAQL